MSLPRSTPQSPALSPRAIPAVERAWSAMASRVAQEPLPAFSRRAQGGYTVGVLVQCNCGRRPQLMIAGVPVGKEIPGNEPYAQITPFALPGSELKGDVGSIIIVIATDAPLLPHQLKRIARRASLGLARTGSISGNGSGDIFIAFSTANPHANDEPGPNTVKTVSNERISPLFEATVEATEEAIVNAMVGAKTMTGIDGHTVIALPHDKLQQALKKYNR